MKTITSATDWKIGDKGITNNGDIVTVKAIYGGRYIEIEESLTKKVYIPAHGEIRKATIVKSGMKNLIDGTTAYLPYDIIAG